jgi:SPP1 gp7 family putative phage head morphogenesis protein
MNITALKRKRFTKGLTGNANPNHDELGRFTTGNVPPKIGTAKVPEGHIRLFHYTRGNPQQIREQGLKLSNARGHTYGEPDMIWGSTQPPSLDHNIVEYHIPANDEMLSHMANCPRKGEDLKEFMKGTQHVGMVRDIIPKEIIGVHEPWHHKYHYIQEHPDVKEATLKGEHDALLDMDDYGPAVRKVKEESSITSNTQKNLTANKKLPTTREKRRATQTALKQRASGTPISKIDPTRTITLRRSFASIISRQFAQLKGEIFKMVVTEDSFGLKKKQPTTNAKSSSERLMELLNNPNTLDWAARNNVQSITVNENPNHDELGRFTTSETARLSYQLHKLQHKIAPHIANDEHLRSLGKRIAAAVDKTLNSPLLHKIDSIAMKTCDQWILEQIINTQRPGTVLAAKVTALAASKAYIKFRDMYRGMVSNTEMDNQVQRLFNLIRQLEDDTDGVFKCPSLEEIRDRLSSVTENVGNPNHDELGRFATIAGDKAFTASMEALRVNTKESHTEAARLQREAAIAYLKAGNKGKSKTAAKSADNHEEQAAWHAEQETLDTSPQSPTAVPKKQEEDKSATGSYDTWTAKYSDWGRSLSDKQKIALSDYQDNSFRNMNKILRSGGKLPKAVSDIDKSIASNKLHESITVFRGPGKGFDTSSLKVGTEFVDKAFVSTSIHPTTGEGEADRVAHGVFKIRVKEGFTAAVMNANPGHQIAYAHEQEVLLPRGCKFKVDKISEEGGKKTWHLSVEHHSTQLQTNMSTDDTLLTNELDDRDSKFQWIGSNIEIIPLTQNENPNHDERGRFSSGIHTAIDYTKSSMKAAQDILDKVPGVKWLREKSQALTNKLKQRYGVKTAAAIIASGQLFGWGLMGVGIATTGVPFYVPGSTIIGMAPAAALAEIHYQLSGKYKQAQVQNEQELSQDEIDELGKELYNQLHEDWLQRQLTGITDNTSTDEINEAAQQAHPNPSKAQIEAANYKCGHVVIQGLPITIETAAGNKRKPWHDKPIAYHYGYIKRTRSDADGDHIDVFLGPNPESEVVFVVDQVKDDKGFDEHKCMIGWTNEDDAKEAYLANYSDDWDGFGGIRALTMKEFKDWIQTGDTSKPIVGQIIVNANTQKSLTSNADYQFLSDPDKIKVFQEWLKKQLKSKIIGLTQEQIWQKYAEAGFKKGAGRAFDDTRAAERALSSTSQAKLDWYNGTRDEFLRSTFGQPVSVDKIKLLAGRSFDDLEGVTDTMSLKMSRVLTDGLVEGKGMEEIADDLNKEVDIGEDRALTVARTEIIRCHAEGQLNAFENLGVKEVGVAAEFATAAGDTGLFKEMGVCPDCAALSGVVLKVEEARNIIPVHPGCRCCWLPANVGEDDDNQVRDKKDIDDALEEAGVEDKDIDNDRPESVFNSLSINGLDSDFDALHPRDEVGKFVPRESGDLIEPREHGIKLPDGKDLREATLLEMAHRELRTQRKTTVVPLDRIRAIQSTVLPDVVNKYMDKYTNKSSGIGMSRGIELENGTVVIDNGTHRIEAQRRLGRKTVKIRLLKFEDTKSTTNAARKTKQPQGPDGRFLAGGSHEHLADLHKVFPGATVERLQQLHDRGARANPDGTVTTTKSTPNTEISKPTFDMTRAGNRIAQTVGRLGAKSYNFVHLGDLRDNHPELSKDQFDSALHQARLSGKITLSPAEGRHGVNERDKNSAVYDKGLTPDDDRMMLWASLRPTTNYDYLRNLFPNATEDRLQRLYELTRNNNPNHDELGRFATGDYASHEGSRSSPSVSTEIAEVPQDKILLNYSNTQENLTGNKFNPSEPRDAKGEWTKDANAAKDDVQEQIPNEKAARAKAFHVPTKAEAQRYAEEYSEPRLAKILGGKSLPDSEPNDVETDKDLIELKTMLVGKKGEITMDSYSQVRKIIKEKETGKTFHTIVSDDRKIYNAKGEGQHDESQGRTYYYRRGVAGSVEVKGMHKCKDEAELKRLIKMDEKDLPKGAQRTDRAKRVGKWKFFISDEGRKGYRNSKTGKEFMAKK